MKHFGILCVSTTVEDAAAKFAAALSGSQAGLTGYSVAYKSKNGPGQGQFALVGADAIKTPFSPLSGRQTLKSVMGMSVSSALEGYKPLPDTVKSQEDPTAQPMAYHQECGKCRTHSLSTNVNLLQNCVTCGTGQDMKLDGEIRLTSESSDDDGDHEYRGDDGTANEDDLVDEEEDTEVIDDDLSDGADVDGGDEEIVITQEDIDDLSPEEVVELTAELADVLGEDATSLDLSDISKLDDNQREQLTALFYDSVDGGDEVEEEEVSESRQDGPAGTAHDPAEVVSDIPFFQKKDGETSESAGDGYAQLCNDIKDIIGDEADCKTEAGEVYVPEHMRDTVLDGLVAHGWKLDHEELYKGDVRVQITEAVGHRMRLSTSSNPEGPEGVPNTSDLNMLGQPEQANVEEVSTSGKAGAKFPAFKSKSKAKTSKSGDDCDEEDEDGDDGDGEEEDDEIGVDDMLSVSSIQSLDRAATPLTSAVTLARTFTSISSSQAAWVLMVDGFPVASLSAASAQAAGHEIAGMIDKPQDFEAVALAAMQEQGIADGARALGFTHYEMPLPVRRVVENMLSESEALMAQQFDQGMDHVKAQFQDAVSLSYMGMNTDFFPGAAHPLKAALFNSFSNIAEACGLDENQAAAMTAAAITESFAQAGAQFGQMLVSHAMNLMAMPEQARTCIQENIVATAQQQGQVTTNLSSN